MEQAHRTEITDRTTVEAEVDMDATGENVLIRDEMHGFDFEDMSVAPGSSGASSSNAPPANPGAPSGETYGNPKP